MSSWRGVCTSLSLFPFWRLDANGGEDSYLYHFSSYFSFAQCVMDMCSTCDGYDGQELIYVWLVKLFMEI
jgi:hypothetical protein